MPKYLKEAGSIGAIPILILLASVGLLSFLLISNTFNFKDTLFDRLFPKPSSEAAQEAKSVPDEILLKFKKDIPENAKENIRNSQGLKVEDVIKQIGVEKVKVAPEARDKVIEALNNNPNIEFAEPNFIGELQAIPNDPNFPTYQNGYNNSTNYGGPLWWIQAAKAWDITTGSPSVPVAVLDTGIRIDHEDLQGKIWVNPGEIAGNNIDDDGNGYVDDINGWNTYYNNNNISVTSASLQHGTNVSGIIAATTNNGKQMAAVSWQSPIMMVRISDDNSSFDSVTASKAMIYAAQNGAKAINASWGISTSWAPTVQTIQDAVDFAWNRGSVLVAAAGNGNSTPITLYPARLPNVIAVGATDRYDVRWTYVRSTDGKTLGSSYGVGLDVMAPGAAIYTLSSSGPIGENNPSGTSLSAAHVSGLAALIFAANPNLTNQQVVDIINQTADKVGDVAYDDLTTNNCNGWNQYYGCGRINAYNALLAATGGTPPTPSPTPTVGPTSTPTPTANPETSAPVISNISSTTTANSATIKWTTNIPATSRVGYGLTTTLGSTTTENTSLVTSHSVTISGLTKATKYYYKVISKNSIDLESSSSIQQFRTKNK